MWTFTAGSCCAPWESLLTCLPSCSPSDVCLGGSASGKKALTIPRASSTGRARFTPATTRGAMCPLRTEGREDGPYSLRKNEGTGSEEIHRVPSLALPCHGCFLVPQGRREVRT